MSPPADGGRASPDLRGVMRHFATGVCVATTYRDTPSGRRHDAVTVNSLGSISLDPPLVSLSFRRGSAFLADLCATGVWAVSILSAHAREVARLLACTRPSAQRTLARWPLGRVHTPVRWCSRAPARLECTLRERFELGDHVLVVGDVQAAGHDKAAPTLVFLRGCYHAVSDLPAPTVDPNGPGHWGDAL